MNLKLADADGGEGWQDTMAEACHEDAGFGMRHSGAQQTRWLDHVKRDRVSTWSEIGCLHGT